MEDTDVAQAAGDEGIELTEIEALNVQRIDGVKTGSNGFPHLIMKGLAKADAAAHAPFTGDHTHDHPAFGGPDGDGDGVHGHQHTHDGDNDHHHEHAEPADAAGKSARELAVKAVTGGQVDEAPDIDLGQQVMRLLGHAISAEAEEISAGRYGETRDVGMLSRAADIVSCWIAREQATEAGQDPDAPCGCCQWCSGMGCGCCPGCGAGMVMCSAADDVTAKAKLSAAERDKLDDSDFAIPETRSYPIHDESHARNALARVAQHGTPSEKRRVRAAVRKRYPDIDSDDTAKSTVAEGETDVHTDAQGTDDLSKAVEDAVTKATKPLSERIETLSAELAKVKATPLPGGPVLSNVRPTARTADGDDWAAKAALYRAKADAATTPADREGYRHLAREADEKAQAAQPA